MRNPPFDPNDILIEDQRGTIARDETVFDIVKRVTASNYRRGGLAGVFGVNRVFPSIGAPPPARTLDGKTFTLDSAKVKRMGPVPAPK